MAVSSGYVIGSCSWIIQTLFDKVVYMGNTSILNTHADSANIQQLKGANVLITGFLPPSDTDGDTDKMVSDLCRCTVATIQNGGTVLFPMLPVGTVFDLIEFVTLCLDNAGQSSTKIYFVSPTALPSLSYADIYSEWLCSIRKSKAYIPETPFSHSHLVNTKRLICAKSASEIETQVNSVIICGHPSLDFGSFRHYWQHFKDASESCVILTSPTFSLDSFEKLTPFSVKVLKFPITTALSRSTFLDFLHNSTPQTLVCHSSHKITKSLCPTNMKLITLENCDHVHLNLEHDHEEVLISQELSENLFLNNQHKSMCYTQFSCNLSTFERTCELQPIDLSFIRSRQDLMIDEPSFAHFSKELKEAGMAAQVTFNNVNAYTVKINNQVVANIETWGNRTSVKVSSAADDSQRDAVINAALSCFPKCETCEN